MGMMLGIRIERVGDAMGENVRNENHDIEYKGRRFQETSSDVAA